MATVGSLVVKLTAHTKAFRDGLRGSGRHVTTFGSKVQGLSKRMLGLGAAFTGVAVGGGFAMFLRSQMKSIDAMAKLSDRLGTNIQELQRLRHAAELTGAGADTLDAALTTMAKRLGEAGRGAGAARPALEALGLDAKKLAAMRPDQAFYRIAEAISKQEKASIRAGHAANIFSKGNMNIINTLMLGKRGLVEMGRELDRLGGTITRVEAKAIENANDALTRLGHTVTITGGEFAAALAPGIESLASSLARLIPKVVKSAASLDELLYVWLQFSKTVYEIHDRVDPFNWFRSPEELQEIQDNIKAMENAISRVTQRMANRINEAAAAGGNLNRVLGIPAPRNGLEQAAMDAALFGAELEKAEAKIERLRSALATFGSTANEQMAQALKGTPFADEAAKLVQELARKQRVSTAEAQMKRLEAMVMTPDLSPVERLVSELAETRFRKPALEWLGLHKTLQGRRDRESRLRGIFEAGTDGAATPTFAAGASEGSREAYSAMIRASWQGAAKKQKTDEQILAELRQQTAAEEEIAARIKRLLEKLQPVETHTIGPS